MNTIEKLRQYCLENKVTQLELSKKLGVTVVTVNRWFNAKSQPSDIQMHQIKKLLGLDSNQPANPSEIYNAKFNNQIKQYVEERPIGESLVRSEINVYYRTDKRSIESIFLSRNAETGEEEVIISYIAKFGKDMEKPDFVRIPGKEFVEMIIKHQGGK